MPFSDPPIPSSFTIGNINAGHATFDQNGVTFYALDGITPIFRYNFSTGQLTLSSQLAAQSVSITANELEFSTGDVAETQKAHIINKIGGVGVNRRAALEMRSGSLTGDPGSSVTCYSYTADGLATNFVDINGDHLITLSANSIQSNGILQTGVPTGILDSAARPYLQNRSGSAQRGISAGAANGTTDASGIVTMNHGCVDETGAAITPISVMWIGHDAVYQIRMQTITNTTFTLFLRNNVGGVVVSTAVQGYFIAYA